MPAANHTILIQDIDAWLPQTQCTACGYPRCLAYAEAIFNNEVGINRCPPGNDITIRGLATLLNVPVTKPDPEVGPHQPRRVYYIDESRCIGCTLCIKACPVDAIIGTGKFMHNIIEDECTGCDLCVPPCPMDCVLTKASELPPDTVSRWPDYPTEDTTKFRARTNQRLARIGKITSQQTRSQKQNTADLDRARIRAEINDAVLRTKQKKAAQEKSTGDKNPRVKNKP